MTSRLAKGYLALVLTILPFQWLWLRILQNHGVTGKPLFLLTQWYEAGIILLALFALVGWLCRNRRFSGLITTDYLALALFGYACLSWLWSHHSIGYHIIGLRYSIMALYAYTLGRLAGSSSRRLLWIIFWAVIAIALLQVVGWLTLPLPLLNALELPITHRAVSLPQVYGSFIGPNQLGLYMVAVCLLALAWKPRGYQLLAGLSLIVLALSSARSAAVALVVVGLVMFLTGRGQVLTKLLSLLVVVALFAGLITFIRFAPGSELAQAVTHGGSTPAHILSVEYGYDQAVQAPAWQRWFGHGVGEAGPATYVRSQPFIVESWYLQVFYEYGLIGGLLYLGYLIWLMKSLWQPNRVLSLLVGAFLVVSLFLPALSDNPVTVVLVFALAGSALSPQVPGLLAEK